MGKRKNSRPTKLKINENLTSELQIKEEAKRIHKLSESQPKTAAQLIRKLCKEHTNIGYLFWVQTDMLQRRHNDATEPHVRKQHLDEAKLSANKAIELNPKSILFAYTLGLVYSKEVLETNDWRAAIERFDTAIQQYNTALQIENPTDPFHDGYEPEPEPGSLRAIYKGTYDQRIKGVRGIICRDLAGCLRKLMVLKTETSIIKASLERLEMDEDEKVKISWISLRPVDKKRFVKVKIRYLISHIRESRNHFASEILEQALDFNGAHEEWKFWLCYCCEERFPDYESLLLHASATHWEGLFSKHRETFPLRVDDWAPFMNKTWMAIDSSAARIMLEQKQELLSAKRNKSSNIGNDKVIEKNQITEEPSSSGGEVQSLEEERDLQETPEVDATFELLNYDENPWLKKDILRWDWPSPKDVDARRSYLLKLIQDRLNNLKLGRCVLAAHMDILIQRAMSKMDDLYRDLLKELSVNQTHYCLCLLDASELKEIFRFLHNISEFSKKISKQGTIMEDTPDYDTWASEREGLIMLTANSKSLILILLNGHTLSEQSVSESSSAGSACTDGGGSKTQDPPDIDYLFSWLSLNSSSYEHLKEWRKLRDKRRQHGREELNKCEERLLESLENVYESQEPSASENNDTGLSNTVERILQIAEDMRQFESIHERFAAYDYQPILLSIVMPYTRQCMESIIDDYVAMKYNAAAAVDGMGDESTAPEKEAAKECKATDVMADENTSAENEATGECKAIDEDLAAGHGGEEGVHNWSTSGSNKGMQEEQIIEGKGTLSSTGQRPTGHEGDQILQDGFTAVLSKAEKKRMKKQNAAKANQWDQQVRYMKAESTRQEKLDYEGFAINEVEEAMRQSLENLQEPTEDASTSKKDAPKPTEDVLHLEDAPKPAEDAPEPTEDVPQLEDAPVPAEDASNPAKDAREPTEHASEPTEHPPKPSEDVPQLDAPELAEDALKPMEDAPKPTVDAPGPTEDASEPAENVPQLEDVPDPAKDASAATEDAPNPADNVPQLGKQQSLGKKVCEPRIGVGCSLLLERKTFSFWFFDGSIKILEENPWKKRVLSLSMEQARWCLDHAKWAVSRYEGTSFREKGVSLVVGENFRGAFLKIQGTESEFLFVPIGRNFVFVDRFFEVLAELVDKSLALEVSPHLVHRVVPASAEFVKHGRDELPLAQGILKENMSDGSGFPRGDTRYLQAAMGTHPPQVQIPGATVGEVRGSQRAGDELFKVSATDMRTLKAEIEKLRNMFNAICLPSVQLSESNISAVQMSGSPAGNSGFSDEFLCLGLRSPEDDRMAYNQSDLSGWNPAIGPAVRTQLPVDPTVAVSLHLTAPVPWKSFDDNTSGLTLQELSGRTGWQGGDLTTQTVELNMPLLLDYAGLDAVLEAQEILYLLGLEDAPELVKDALKPASDAPELAKDAPEPTEDAPKQADDVPQLEDAPETAEDVRVEDIPKPAEDASEPAKNVPEEDSPGPESTKNAPEEDTPEPAEDVPEGDDPDPAEDATEPAAVDGMGDESAAPEKDAAEECKATDVMADTGEDAPDTSEDVRVEDTPKPAEDASEPAKNVPEEDSPGPESAKNAPEEDSTVSEEDAPEPAEDVPEEDDPDPAADAPEEESTEDDPEEDDPDPAEDAPEEDSTVPEEDPPEPAEDVPEVDDPDPAEDAPEPEEDVSDPGVVIFGSIPCLLRR